MDFLKTLNIDESVQLLSPNVLINSRESSRPADIPPRTTAYFAKKSKMTSRAPTNDAFKSSFSRVELEQLRSPKKTSKSENFIEAQTAEDKLICFGDKLILFFEQTETESTKRKTMGMFGEGWVRDSVSFHEISESYCSESVKSALFEVVDARSMDELTKEMEIELKWENEEAENDANSEVDHPPGQSRVLFYGEGFLLRHCQSRKFLSLSSFSNSENNASLRFDLKESSLDLSVFNFCSASRLTETESRVGYNDSMFLRNERHFSYFTVQESREAAYEDHFLVATELEETKWRACLFERENEGEGKKGEGIRDGDIVQFYEPNNDAFLCCDSSKSLEDREQLTLMYPQSNEFSQGYSVDVSNVQNPFFRGYEVCFRKNSGKNVHSLWEVKTKEFGKNETVSYNESVILKNLGSGGVLRYNFNDSKFCLEDPLCKNALAFSFSPKKDPLGATKIQVGDRLSIKMDDFWVSYKIPELHSINLVDGSAESKSQASEDATPNYHPNKFAVELTQSSQMTRLTCVLKRDTPLTSVALNLSHANNFLVQSHHLFLTWDMTCRMGIFEHDFPSAMKNRHFFVARVDQFVQVIARLSKLCLNYQSQSANFQIDFGSLDVDFTGFEEAIQELGLAESLIEILNLLINKTYSISLKLLNMQSVKDQDNDDFMTYKRLANSLEKSNKQQEVKALKEMPSYQTTMRTAIRFLSLLVGINPKLGLVIQKKSDFIVKLYHFCEEDSMELANLLLASPTSDESLATLAGVYLKHVFCAEEQSRFLIQMLTQPKFFPNLLTQLANRKYTELAKVLASHLFLTNPFVFFASTDGLDGGDYDYVRGLRDDSDVNQSEEESKFEIHLSLPEGKLTRRIQ